MKQRRISLTWKLIVITLIGTVLPACANNDSSKEGQYGGNIKVGIFDNFPGFCVSNNPANSALMATRTIYETLFEKTEDGEFVGLLATDATPSTDLKKWSVNLREGITFHDGTPFNADAVIANFNAITGRVAAATFASSGVAGLQAKSYTVGTGTAFTANILDAKKTGEYSVDFILERPQNDFPATLYASGRFFMRSPAQFADATTCGQKPIGTGPFEFSSFTPNQLVVKRNENYWRRDPRTTRNSPISMASRSASSSMEFKGLMPFEPALTTPRSSPQRPMQPSFRIYGRKRAKQPNINRNASTTHRCG